MEYGYIRVKVEEMRLKKGISKNKLCHAAELERKQLNLNYSPLCGQSSLKPHSYCN